MRALRWLTVASLLMLAAGCGAHAADGEEAKVPSAAGATANAPAPTPTELTSSTAPRTLRREDVQNAIRAGLGAFLQRIDFDVEHPVFEGGRFKGFRVVALKGEPSFWRGVDLKPGDVVTRVNAKPIERPEQALETFYSLANARELRVTFDRRGEPRELVFPIE